MVQLRAQALTKASAGMQTSASVASSAQQTGLQAAHLPVRLQESGTQASGHPGAPLPAAPGQDTVMELAEIAAAQAEELASSRQALQLVGQLLEPIQDEADLEDSATQTALQSAPRVSFHTPPAAATTGVQVAAQLHSAAMQAAASSAPASVMAELAVSHTAATEEASAQTAPAAGQHAAHREFSPQVGTATDRFMSRFLQCAIVTGNCHLVGVTFGTECQFMQICTLQHLGHPLEPTSRLNRR